MGSLPDGRRGQALALALLAIALAVLWLAVAGPVTDWYEARTDQLARERVVAARMGELANTLPALEREAAAGRTASTPAAALLPGGSDALAAAALQERLGAIARDNGATLTSSELLPVQAIGRYRRIGLRLALSASYPNVVALLRAIAAATPAMLADDLRLHAPFSAVPGQAAPMEVGLTVSAFRGGDAAAAAGRDEPTP